jgi:putative membrane protein
MKSSVRTSSDRVWRGIVDSTRVGKELAAISATPTPDPKDWVFSSVNNRFASPHGSDAGHATPEEWVNRGMGRLQAALSGL